MPSVIVVVPTAMTVALVACAAAVVRPGMTDYAVVLDDVVMLHVDAWSTPRIVGPLDDDGGRGIVGVRRPIVRVLDWRGDEATTESQAQGDEPGASVDAIHGFLLDRDARAWNRNAAANTFKCNARTRLRSGTSVLTCVASCRTTRRPYTRVKLLPLGIVARASIHSSAGRVGVS